MDEQYERILNMTNKEAAAIIKNTLMTQAVGRANGKTMMVAALNHALIKAIAVLENTPDSEALAYTNKLCDALYLED